MTQPRWTPAPPRAQLRGQRRPPLQLAPLEHHGAVAAAVAAVFDVVDRHVEGPLRQIVVEHLATGGKRVRVDLALRCAAAVGAPLRHAVAVAAASELLHNATLIHDDLQDGDRTRRGAPTVWARHGTAQAINAGDVLLMLPFVALAEAADGASRIGLTATLARRAAATACGQADELAMLGERRLDWADYQAAAVGKTGQILAIAFESAALLAGLDRERAREVGDHAARLGLAYQVADDVLDLYGDKGRGEVGHDLREGKVSAVVAAHLERCPDACDDLVALLSQPREATDDADVTAQIARFVQSGAPGLALQRARDACAFFDHITLPTPVAGLAPLLCGLRERFLAPAEAAWASARAVATR